MSYRMRCITLLLFASFTLAPAAVADSIITITQALVLIPPQGGGDEGASTMSGPGVSISGGAVASCDFCRVAQFFLPGESVNASVPFISPFESILSAQIGGKTYDSDQISFGTSFITSGTITFPGGSTLPPVFTVTLPATFGHLRGNIIQGGQPLTLEIPSGKLVATFDLVLNQGGYPAYYTYKTGEFIASTPEPGSILLFGTGLLVLVLLQIRTFGWHRPTRT